MHEPESGSKKGGKEMNDFFGVLVSILGCGIVWNLIGIALKLERIADALEPDEDEEEGGGE